MAHYAIGDIQGCYSELMTLLDKIAFNEKTDTLWCAGDIINGGPDNISVLRFLSQLPQKNIIILGNHDLHFLAVFHKIRPLQSKDTFEDVLKAPDAEKLSHWLQTQSLAHYDTSLNCLMTHAGVYPAWSLEETLSYAKEIETQLNPQNPEKAHRFLTTIFEKTPSHWRLITDIFTRMRFCDSLGHLDYTHKGTISDAPSGLYPWFDEKNRAFTQNPIWASANPINILFGHWAALEEKFIAPYSHLFALDAGCAWGGKLSALRLEDKQWFQVRGKKYR